MEKKKLIELIEQYTKLSDIEYWLFLVLDGGGEIIISEDQIIVKNAEGDWLDSIEYGYETEITEEMIKSLKSKEILKETRSRDEGDITYVIKPNNIYSIAENCTLVELLN